jgi:hypothetical protein
VLSAVCGEWSTNLFRHRRLYGILAWPLRYVEPRLARSALDGHARQCRTAGRVRSAYWSRSLTREWRKAEGSNRPKTRSTTVITDSFMASREYVIARAPPTATATQASLAHGTRHAGGGWQKPKRRLSVGRGTPSRPRGVASLWMRLTSRASPTSRDVRLAAVEALFSSQKNLQNFLDSSLHRIFRNMPEALNINKK